MLTAIIITLVVIFISIAFLSRKQEQEKQKADTERDSKNLIYTQNVELVRKLNKLEQPSNTNNRLTIIQGSNYIEKISKLDLDNEHTIAVLCKEDITTVKLEILSYFPAINEINLFVTDKEKNLRSIRMTFEAINYQVNEI